MNLYTIGHGNRSWEDFSELLTKYNINTLIDVRSIPYSRFFPQFRRNILKENLEKVGVNYLFMGDELGGRPKDTDLYTDDKVSYDKLKKSNLFQKGISQLLNQIEKNNHVVIMCSELDQNRCHRKHLLTAELQKYPVKIIHINKNGELEEESENNTLF